MELVNALASAVGLLSIQSSFVVWPVQGSINDNGKQLEETECLFKWFCFILLHSLSWRMERLPREGQHWCTVVVMK